MAFFDKLNSIARNIGDKANEAIETTKLNSKINAEKNALTECYKKIGELYYKRYQAGNTDEPDVMELYLAIDKHNETIIETQSEIARIQAESTTQEQAAQPDAQVVGNPSAVNGVICPSCGQSNLPGTKFCSGCGQNLQEAAAPSNGKCTACDFDNPPGTKFCGGCGTKL